MACTKRVVFLISRLKKVASFLPFFLKIFHRSSAKLSGPIQSGEEKIEGVITLRPKRTLDLGPFKHTGIGFQHTTFNLESRRFVLETMIFRGYLSLREGRTLKKPIRLADWCRYKSDGEGAVEMI